MGAVTLTPRQAHEDAAAVYRRVMETPWPNSREARWAIGWAASSLWEAMAEGADADLVHDLAVALEKVLGEHVRRDEAAKGETAA